MTANGNSHHLERLNIFPGVLGCGAAGEVYKGQIDDRCVAIKVVRGPVMGEKARKKTRDAWIREKRTALMLQRHPHRNILQYFDAFEVEREQGPLSEGDGVIVMELGRGLPLPMGEREDPRGPIVFKSTAARQKAALRAGRVAVQLINALAHLHGVVKTIHRDVKPDNIVIPESDEDDENTRICLCDFSAARTQMYTLQRASTTQGIGTHGFLAPEMNERGARYCSKVDIWALGCTIISQFNSGRPCSADDFYGLTLALLYDDKNTERICNARAKLDEGVRAFLETVLPDEEAPASALRALLVLCFQSDPVNRPSAWELLQHESVRTLAQLTGIKLDEQAEYLDILEGAVEPSTVVASMLQDLVERFDFSNKGHLEALEIGLVRDRLHRSLEEKDMRSTELMNCWLSFLEGTRGILGEADAFTGRTLLHAVVQNHRPEELLGMLEDFCDEDSAVAADSDAHQEMREMVDAKDWEGRTALWLACAAGTAPLACVRLLELRADVGARDYEGISPLERCAGSGFDRPGEQRSKVITALIAFGAGIPEDVRNKSLSIHIREALEQPRAGAKAKTSVWQAELQDRRVDRKVLRGSLNALSRSLTGSPINISTPHVAAEGTALSVALHNLAGVSVNVQTGHEKSDGKAIGNSSADLASSLRAALGIHVAGSPTNGSQSKPQKGIIRGDAMTHINDNVAARDATSKPCESLPCEPPGATSEPNSPSPVANSRGNVSRPATHGSARAEDRSRPNPGGASRRSSSQNRSASPEPGGTSRRPSSQKRSASPTIPVGKVSRAGGANAGSPAAKGHAGGVTLATETGSPAQASSTCPTGATDDTSGVNSVGETPPPLSVNVELQDSTHQVLDMLSPTSAVRAAEVRLREYLQSIARGHARAAFKIADRNFDARVSAEEMLILLAQVLPDLSDAVTEHVQQHFAGGVGFHEFARWLRGQSSFVAEANSRRHLEVAAPAVNLSRIRSDGDEHRSNTTLSRVVSTASVASNNKADSRQKTAAVSNLTGSKTKSPPPGCWTTSARNAGKASDAAYQRHVSRMRHSKAPERKTPERAAGFRGTAATNARLRSALVALFTHLDDDGNGLLSPEEFSDGQRILAECSGQADCDQMLLPNVSRTGDFELDEWLSWVLDQMVPVVHTPKLHLAQRLEAWLTRHAGR